VSSPEIASPARLPRWCSPSDEPRRRNEPRLRGETGLLQRYYSGTVTAQNYGVSPFPVSFTVVGQKYATTKIITKLKIGPIHMMCLSNVGSIQEPVTIPVLSGFPTIKSNGFLEATFLYTNAGWTKAGFNTNQPPTRRSHSKWSAI